jgi:hypothetical protein
VEPDPQHWLAPKPKAPQRKLFKRGKELGYPYIDIFLHFCLITVAPVWRYLPIKFLPFLTIKNLGLDPNPQDWY